jgi:hypothetical protein
MNKYLIIILLGTVLGYLGIESGIFIIDHLPDDLFLSDSAVPFFLPLALSFLPFVLATLILVFYCKGFCKHIMGLTFSIAYYLPFQYRAIFFRSKDDNVIDPLGERLITTAIVIILLTAVYCISIKIKNKIRT